MDRTASLALPKRAEDMIATLMGAKAILLDWDGCASIANQPFPMTIDFIEFYGDRVVIVSNNSTLLPADIVHVLAKAGACFPAERVLLAGCEALIAGAELGADVRALVLGSPRMKAFAKRIGLNLVQDGVELVVLLRDTRFSYAKLERAVQALRLGARLIVANPDRTHPGANGALVPETGALLAAIGACIDLSANHTAVIGKPSAGLFEKACRLLQATPGEAVMIGDNPSTDIAGAHALGMGSILVAPGSALTLDDLVPREFGGASVTRSPHRSVARTV